MQRNDAVTDNSMPPRIRSCRLLWLFTLLALTAVDGARGATQREMIVAQQSEAEIIYGGFLPDTEVVPLTGSVTILDESSPDSIQILALALNAGAAHIATDGGIGMLPSLYSADLSDMTVSLLPGSTPFASVGPSGQVSMTVPLVFAGTVTESADLNLFGTADDAGVPYPFAVVVATNLTGHYLRTGGPGDPIQDLQLSGPADLSIPTADDDFLNLVFVMTMQAYGGDVDLDGLPIEQDNCPTVPNPSQIDADADGVGDDCDPCPADPLNDPDGDGVCNDIDNCQAHDNPGQEDQDGDGLGDSCDPDRDGDGANDNRDNCPIVANASQRDDDGDGIGDSCDNCAAAPNPGQEDADSDGLGDVCDPCAIPLAKLRPGKVVIADATADPDGTGPGALLWSFADGSGLEPYADSLAFAAPGSIDIDPSGHLVVADPESDPFGAGAATGAVYRIDPRTCAITVAAWHPDWVDPIDLDLDPLGNSWIVDSAAGALYHAGTSGAASVIVGAGLNQPLAVSVRPGPDVFLADSSHGQGRVHTVDLTDGTLLEWGAGAFFLPVDLGPDGQGNEFILDADRTGQVDRLELPSHTPSNFTSDPAWDDLLALALDADDDLLVANGGKSSPVAIYSAAPDGTVTLWSDDPLLRAPRGMAVVGLPFVANEGESVGFPPTIVEIDQRLPDVAYNELKDEYAAVWLEDGEILARIVKPDGRVAVQRVTLLSRLAEADPDCTVIPLCADPISYEWTEPSIVHQVHTVTDIFGAPIARSGKYVVTAERHYENGRVTIAMRQFDDQLVPSGNAILLTPQFNGWSSDTALLAHPVAASLPTSNLSGLPFQGNTLMVVWEMAASTSGDPDGLYGALIDLPGVPSGPFAIATGGGVSRSDPAAAWGGDFLVAFERDNRIAARRVDIGGTVLDTTDIYVSGVPETAVGARDPDLAYNTADDEFLIVWTENRSDPAEIVAQRVNASGVPQRGNITIDPNPEAPGNPFDGRPSARPVVASTGTAGEWLVVYEEYQENGTLFASPRGLFARRFSNAAPGSEIPVFRTGPGSYRPAIAHDGGRDAFLLLFEHDYDGTGSDNDIWGRILENSDGDSRTDIEDNCPRIANSDQANADNDQFGDVCDPFPADGGNDQDDDGIGGTVDNCLFIPNGPDGGTCVAGLTGIGCDADADCDYGLVTGVCSLGQEDLDGDGLGDACDIDRDGDGVTDVTDCDDLDAARFPGNPEICDGIDNDCDGVIDPPPGFVTGLLHDDVMLDWNPGGGATRFDVVAGDLNRYRQTGSLTDAITDCAANDILKDEMMEMSNPGLGEAIFWVVRGGSCAGDGSYDTAGTGQAAPRDAAIAASADSCP